MILIYEVYVHDLYHYYHVYVMVEKSFSLGNLIFLNLVHYK